VGTFLSESMKKLPITIPSLVFVALIGIGVNQVAPLLKDPRFEIINQSQHVVYVSEYWRSEFRDLGAIQPSSIYVFNVDDEASMKFTGRFPDGREVVSKEIYFAGGTGIIAIITENGINVKYDFET